MLTCHFPLRRILTFIPLYRQILSPDHHCHHIASCSYSVVVLNSLKQNILYYIHILYQCSLSQLLSSLPHREGDRHYLCRLGLCPDLGHSPTLNLFLWLPQDTELVKVIYASLCGIRRKTAGRRQKGVLKWARPPVADSQNRKFNTGNWHRLKLSPLVASD